MPAMLSDAPRFSARRKPGIRENDRFLWRHRDLAELNNTAFAPWYGIPFASERTLCVRFRARGASLSRSTLVAEIMGSVLGQLLASAPPLLGDDALQVCTQGFVLDVDGPGQPQLLLRIYSSGDAWAVARKGAVAHITSAHQNSQNLPDEVDDGAHMIIDVAIKALDPKWQLQSAGQFVVNERRPDANDEHAWLQHGRVTTATNYLLLRMEPLVAAVDRCLEGIQYGKALLSPPCVAQCGLAWGLPATARSTTARVAAASPQLSAIAQLLHFEGFGFDVLETVCKSTEKRREVQQKKQAKQRRLSNTLQNKSLQLSEEMQAEILSELLAERDKHGQSGVHTADSTLPGAQAQQASVPSISMLPSAPTSPICAVCPQHRIAIHPDECPTDSRLLQLFRGSSLGTAAHLEPLLVEWEADDAWTWPLIEPQEIQSLLLSRQDLTQADYNSSLPTSKGAAIADSGHASATSAAEAATVDAPPLPSMATSLLSSPNVEQESVDDFRNSLLRDAHKMWDVYCRARVPSRTQTERPSPLTDNEFSSVRCNEWLRNQPALMLTTMDRHSPDIAEEVCGHMPEILAKNSAADHNSSDASSVGEFVGQHGLSIEEVFAIAAYTQDMQQFSLYRALKKSLVKCSTASARLVHMQIWSCYVMHLLSGLSKLPSVEGTIVFRGICNQPGWETRYIHGDNTPGETKTPGSVHNREVYIQWITFASTSLHESEARRFMNPHTGLLLELKTRTAKDIRSFSLLEQEASCCRLNSRVSPMTPLITHVSALCL